MDPNVTLNEMRELCKSLGDDNYSILVEKFEALDGWLCSGGFLPKDWDN